MSSQARVAHDPLISTVNEMIGELKVSRATLYQLLNSGEIESFVEGRSRKIITQSAHAYIGRRLEAERKRRGRAA
jgi:DNA-binding PadR family transcriptional regulator